MKDIQPLADLINLRASYMGHEGSAMKAAFTDTQSKIIAKFDELILKCVEAITLE